MTFKEAIKKYLDEFAKDNEAFAEKYSNKEKSLDNCLSYITGEAKKQVVKNCAVLTDDEVYQLARHYYEETDANLSFKASTSNENNKSVQVEVKQEKAPVKPIIEKKQKEEKKKDFEQLDLFSMLGA